MKALYRISMSICLLFVFGALSAQSNPKPPSFVGYSFAELIKEYEDECNKIVLDTVTVHGSITYKNVPMYRDGEIIGMEVVSVDTIWEEPKCPEFKYSERIYWGGSIVSGIQLYNYQKEEQKITKKCICSVKQREVTPFSEHFWNWIKNKN